jgi:hypothetical protein
VLLRLSPRLDEPYGFRSDLITRIVYLRLDPSEPLPWDLEALVLLREGEGFFVLFGYPART